jgi:hypothetical protein
MKATRGRPKGTNSYSLKPEVLDKFLQRVYQGQSITMLCWEFKLKPFQVKQICKENNVIVNGGDIITYSNKLHGKGIVN